MDKSKPPFSPENRWVFRVSVVGLSVGVLFLAVFLGVAETPIFFCTSSSAERTTKTGTKAAIQSSNSTELLLDAIVHYATLTVVPQLSLQEIRVSFQVLKTRLPCNFLVFGLGNDSVMWNSLNPGGTTLFLEEDPKWVQTVVKDAPYLRAHTVKYRTQLSQADELLQLYKTEPACWAGKLFIRGNEKCTLALNMLPEEVYDKEWDLIMIDAPRGYFAEAPGRMAAIYSAAVMARNRKGPGVTHVFLHDVDRKVEKVYSEMFLCLKYLVKSVGRLRHFEIPPTTNPITNKQFC